MSDLGSLHRSTYLQSGARDFVDFVQARAAGKGHPGDAERFARANRFSPRVAEMLQKTAVPVGSLDGGTWGGELGLIAPASQGFLSLLPPYSAYDRLIADGATTSMPLHTRLSRASSASLASYVVENVAKPITKFTTSSQVMPVTKVMAIIAYTSELLLAAGTLATDLFTSSLRNAVAMATDNKFLGIVGAQTGVVHNFSTGITAATLLHDINLAMNSIKVGVGSKLYLVLPIREYNSARLLRDAGGYIVSPDGKIGDIQLIPTSAETSPGVPVVDAVLLDASAVGTDPGIVIADTTSEANILMDTVPTGTNIVSTFQQNLIAARIERYFGACVLKPESIAVIGSLNVTA